MKLVKFSDLTGEVERIYTGRESGCRCGCRGRYFDPVEKGFTRALNKITKINPTVKLFEKGEYGVSIALAEAKEGEAICDMSDWVDLCLPNDRTITVLYKDKTLTIKDA